jgi:alanyl-tRNA synthetase
LLATAGQPGEKSHIVFGRSDDLDADMGALVHRACALIGGQGGGRASFAQGGGPQGELIPIALEQAYQTLAESLARREG